LLPTGGTAGGVGGVPHAGMDRENVGQAGEGKEAQYLMLATSPAAYAPDRMDHESDAVSGTELCARARKGYS
jgi:hypothetical protein